MYSRKSTRRVYRKRRPRRRVLRRVRRRIPRIINQFKPSIFVKQKYCDLITGNLAAGSSVAYAYQNSVYDPYVAVGGHQPMYTDQYGAIYAEYAVTGIAFKVYATTKSVSADALQLFVVQNLTGTADSITTTAMERKGAQLAMFSGQQRGFCKGYMNVAYMWGVPRSRVLNDDVYSGGTLTSDPTRKTYLVLNIINNSATAVDYVLDLRLMFYVNYRRPVAVAQS